MAKRLHGSGSSVFSLYVKLVLVFVAQPSASAFPVHWIGFAICVAAVNDGAERILALILIKLDTCSKVNEVKMLIGRIFVEYSGSRVAIRNLYLITEYSVSFVETASCGIC